ncbi:hypothetical protein FT641_18135 [Bacillus paranthracis]|uniref:ATP-binding protein n=1 Tax=Bacillus paranthracis TaxID=2026186 RepID=UPI00187AB7EA|nr:ATP-binding protein [Bacillus paranthracis]MBE7114518.1 hypothetical protein [Bacillus paranthracis]MBE7154608.1 hypothetical protein [Bacillus paranthracis]
MVEKERKVIIVAGDMFAHRVFAEYLRGMDDYRELVHDMARVDLIGKVDDNADYEDEESRLVLDRFVSLGKSVLIVGGYSSGKTTLMKRLIRQKANTETGLVVIDGVTPEYVGEASKELQEKGLSVCEDVSILATLAGNNANLGLAQFMQYWSEHNSLESFTEATNPIDVVALMDKGKVVGLFEVHKNGEDGDVLEPLNETEIKIDIHQNEAQDKAVAIVKTLITEGNRVVLVMDDVLPVVKVSVVRMLAYELSKSRNVTMFGMAADYDTAVKDSNIATTHSYKDWEVFQSRLAGEGEPIDFLIYDRGGESALYVTINYLVEGNPGLVVDGYTGIIERDCSLSCLASRYMTGASPQGDISYVPATIDGSEMRNRVLTDKIYQAVDKVVTVSKTGDVVVYSVDKTGGYELIKG